MAALGGMKVPQEAGHSTGDVAFRWEDTRPALRYRSSALFSPLTPSTSWGLIIASAAHDLQLGVGHCACAAAAHSGAVAAGRAVAVSRPHDAGGQSSVYPAQEGGRIRATRTVEILSAECTAGTAVID